jgi:hypothetical protein
MDQNRSTPMTHLTPEQSSAVRAEIPLRIVDPDTNIEYVLLRADLYERVRHLFNDPTADAFVAQIESAAAAGWDDPALDVYNDLDPRRT